MRNVLTSVLEMDETGKIGMEIAEEGWMGIEWTETVGNWRKVVSYKLPTAGGR